MQILQALEQEEIIAQGGVSVCEMLERLEKRGEAKGRMESAIGMIKDSMSVKLIMKYTQLPLEKIQELAAQIGVALVM